MSINNFNQNFGGIGSAFSDRNFCFYSVGAITTWVGFFVQLVAVSWHAWELTHSTTWLAIIALLDIVPNVLLAPLAGAIADRYDKYRMMGVVSFLALLQAMAIAALAWTNQLTIWPFATLVLIHGIIISFMVPAMYGILPRFVKRSCLTSAIAVSSSYALGASIFYMSPAFSDQILGLGVVGVSIILASKGIGATLAAIWIAYGGEKMATPQRMLWGFLIFIACVFTIYLTRNLYVAIFAFVVLGMAAETYHTIMTSLVQLSVSEQQRGRVMSTLFMFAQFASGVGTYLIGYYAVSHGLVVPTLIAATLCLIIWLIYFVTRNRIIYKFQILEKN